MKLPQTLRFDELMPVAWQNGGGVTREVVRQENSGESPGWRVSIAELEKPGPFSVIAGVRRHFTVIGAHPVTLILPGKRTTLVPRQSVVFDGDAAVECLLPEGASRALNLMYNPQRWQARVAWLAKGERLKRRPGAETLLVAVGGAARMSSRPAHSLSCYDLWYWSGQDPLLVPVNAAYEAIKFETTPGTHLLSIDLVVKGGISRVIKGI
ncbi:HutD/Ves family protein [Vreelandella boliviensis]|uniref:HutD family protein n=1 Tax=Vreelandella boliviensis LC1 TaxID=1072583 RepID=A0A265DUX0_9GAMM|nr:HutD family protein [Halomonas boliviensis]EHJ91193.1 hypothetical protein KUC_3636 [Halomonas boliviensis LC1]OZT73085.1 hypothetical protein CE457_16290 [Halomonas boliviensis LC1]